jgi:PAS domain S-box-containing protein
MKEENNTNTQAGGGRPADVAMRDSELRYRRLFEAAQDGILILDAETGAIADANPFILKLLGLSLEELTGKKLWEIGAFKDVFANKEKFRELQSSGYARYEGLPLVASDGRHLFVEFVSNVYVVDKQKVIQCNIRDNTDLVLSRAELTESKTLFEMVVENVPLTIFLKEPKDLRFMLLNRAGEDLLGYDRKMFLGKSTLDLFPPEQAAFFTAKDRELLASEAGRLDISEESVLTAKKGTRLLHTRKVCVKGPDGVTKYLLGISEDITDRKREEAEQQASVQELSALAEAMPQIVWITRPDGWNIYFNKQWTTYTGLTPEESRGNGWNKPFHPDDQKKARDAWQKAVSENGTYSLEARLRRADGEYRWWLVRGVPFHDAAGKILKWYGTCTDINDLKLAEEERERMQTQLLQAQKMEAVGVLAGGVAHDFNNILTAIRAYAGFIYKGLLPADPLRGDAQEILTAADRAAALTMQLLAFSRRQVLAPQAVDLNTIVAGMTKMLKRLLREDIQLFTELAGTPCTVMADPGQIEQVIMNLVVNARDAMPRGGMVKLRTEIIEGPDTRSQRGPVVRLRVQDNGHGMSETVKEHLFEPFYTTKEPGKGTGLGLSTVFGIVKQSKGEISFESKVGKGATFSVYLPFLKDAAAKPAAAGQPGAVKKGTETILLVEDDEMLLRLTERILKESGYLVIAASSGRLALEAIDLRGKPVDLLLSDVVMPGMSGRDLARELERRKLARRTLYMSGYTDDAMLKHGVLEPGIALIHKPFSVEAIAARIRGVLDGPASQAKA